MSVIGLGCCTVNGVVVGKLLVCVCVALDVHGGSVGVLQLGCGFVVGVGEWDGVGGMWVLWLGVWMGCWAVGIPNLGIGCFAELDTV